MNRRNVFVIITVLFPVLFFLLLEGLLSVTRYGGDLDLVIQKRILGRNFFVINRSVAQRYFPPGSPTIPEPSEDYFSIEKGDSTLRVF